MHRSDDVARLHRLALSFDSQAPQRPRWLERLIARVAFWAISVRQIYKYHSLFGDHVRRTHRISRWRQHRELWQCMWRHNQCARHYYWRKLFLIPNRASWLDNFEHRQVNTMLDHLNAHVPARQIANKREFAEHCRIHRINTPMNLAIWETGGALVTPIPDDPRCDLFIKPAADFGSVGATAIPYDSVAAKYRWETRLLSWTKLLEIISVTRARRCGYLLQRCLRNSSDAAVYGDSDICNLRIVTGRPVYGVPVLIAAVMRLPSSFTTQGHDRNVLLASVDLKTGQMGPGLFRNITMPQFTHHPDTGFPISGRTLPHWNEMVELVLGAHRTCPWMPFVGWDVVDSDQGLVLLEANANWGGDSAQLPGAPALGQTRFPEIYLEWFEHLKDLRPAGSSNTGTLAGEFQLADSRA